MTTFSQPKEYFGNPDKDEQADAMARFIHTGEATDAFFVPESNSRKLLRGLSPTVQQINDFLNQLIYERDIDVADAFISEWEQTVGIPDDCFDNNGSLADRRLQVIAKFGKMFVSTEEDFINLAKLFGYDITIESGVEGITFPLTFPITMFDTEQDARFTMIVTIPSTTGDPNFPYTFPLTFGSPYQALIECLFNKVKPATCNVIFKYV